MKISNRLKLIASLVDTDNVIDVGCDHALLDIYLTKEGKKCIASDISEQVILKAKENIQKYNLEDSITLIQSNGLENITINPNSTIILAGMGAHTIIEILNTDLSNVTTLLIQSNNDISLVREYITKLGYYIEKEEAILERDKYYIIIKFKKGFKKYTKKDYLLGNLDNEYYKYLLNKNEIILKNLKFKHLKKRFFLKKYNRLLKQKLR